MEITLLTSEIEKAFLIATAFSAFLLIPIFLAATLAAFLQALTSMQDQLLSFAPKFVTGILLLFLGSPWMRRELGDYCREVFRLLGHEL